MGMIEVYSNSTTTAYGFKGILMDVPWDDNALTRLIDLVMPCVNSFLGMRIDVSDQIGTTTNRRKLKNKFESVSVEIEGKTFWSFRAVRPSAFRAGSEAGTVGVEVTFVGIKNKPTQIMIQVLRSEPISEIAYERSVADFMSGLLSVLAIRRKGFCLSGEPIFIEGEDAERNLIEHICKADRDLPVVVVSCGYDHESNLDLVDLAARCAGAAFVYAITPNGSWRLTDAFGKNMSVFNGAVRTYSPGFDPTDDTFGHRLMFINPRANEVELRDHADILVTSVINRAINVEEKLLRYSQIVSLAKNNGIDEAKEVVEPSSTNKDEREVEHLFSVKNSPRVRIEEAKNVSQPQLQPVSVAVVEPVLHASEVSESGFMFEESTSSGLDIIGGEDANSEEVEALRVRLQEAQDRERDAMRRALAAEDKLSSLQKKLTALLREI